MLLLGNESIVLKSLQCLETLRIIHPRSNNLVLGFRLTIRRRIWLAELPPMRLVHSLSHGSWVVWAHDLQLWIAIRASGERITEEIGYVIPRRQ